MNRTNNPIGNRTRRRHADLNRRNLPVRSLLTLSLALTLVLTACEENVTPFTGSDLPFTLWGFMNAGADTQFVRVFPITGELIPDPDATLDARVFSTDLTTGEVLEWTHGVVRFDSLISGHYFWAPFRAEHEHRYRLEVVRSDGATSSVDVRVPSEVEFDVQLDVGSTEIPVEIRGEIPNLIGLRVTYHGVNVPPMHAWPIGTPVLPAEQLPVTIVYDNIAEEIPGGWRFIIDLARDYAGVEAVFRLNCLITLPDQSAPNIWLRDMEFTALAADSTWMPPDGTFDPNILAVPGTFSNVENGYGFFGAGIGVRLEWTPSVSTAQAAGFSFQQRCQGLFARDEPECYNPPEPCIDENLRDLWRLWL